MSSGLKLRMNKYLEAYEVHQGVVANVYSLDSGGQTNSRRNIVIPVGTGTDYTEVSLPPGRYLIEVVLPSGDILSQEQVVREGETEQIEFKTERSAHEWHSWANLLGNVGSETVYKAFTTGAQQRPLSVYELRAPAPELLSGTASATNVWSFLGKLTKDADVSKYQDVLNRLSPGGAAALQTPEDDGLTRVHRFFSGAAGIYGAPGSRSYAFVRSETSLQLVSLPVPWFSIEPDSSGRFNELPVTLFIQQTDGNPALAFSVLDNNLGTALGYMASGALQSAMRLVDTEHAREMLFYKMINPLGAAAGGYLLLGTEQDRKPKPWYQWIENLMRNFPWLPDGAVQQAWLLLRQGATASNRSSARLALSEAYRRGLPYFSVGMQWMVDGLTLLAEGDEEVQKMLTAVKRVAWRLDTSQPFTNLALAQLFRSSGSDSRDYAVPGALDYVTA